MSIIIYIILGIIQGITEVLPISSSGHLLIFESLFGIKFDNMGFEVLLHMASLISIIIYLRKEIIGLLKGLYLYIIKKDIIYKDSLYMIIYLMISMIPLIVVALITKWLNLNFHNLAIVGIMLILNSVMLFSLKKTYNKNKNLNLKNAFIIGLIQSIGIMPGISRSGSCLVGGNIVGLEKEKSRKYAFLLFIPSVMGSFILEFNNIKDIVLLDIGIIPIVITFLITVISTYIAFKLFDYIIKKDKIYMFGYYTLTLGILISIFIYKIGVI